MKMNEHSRELDNQDPQPIDYPPEYLEDYQRWLLMLEVISHPEFDQEEELSGGAA